MNFITTACDVRQRKVLKVGGLFAKLKQLQKLHSYGEFLGGSMAPCFCLLWHMSLRLSTNSGLRIVHYVCNHRDVMIFCQCCCYYLLQILVLSHWVLRHCWDPLQTQPLQVCRSDDQLMIPFLLRGHPPFNQAHCHRKPPYQEWGMILYVGVLMIM